MAKIPNDLKYTRDHEWVRLESDDTAVIGITDFAQESLGDVTFVELPELGDTLETADAFGVVESVKAASDLYMPISGEILEVNEALNEDPEAVNRSPYEEAWMIRVRITNPEDLDALLTPEQYTEIAGE